MKNKYNYIIAIDPAGIGVTGYIVYNFDDQYYQEWNSLKSTTVAEAISNIKNLFDFFKGVANFKPILIIENFFLAKGKIITNPLATAELIGAIKALLEFCYQWDYIIQEPNRKKGFVYKGNLNLNQHEEDAWKHIQYFLKEKQLND